MKPIVLLILFVITMALWFFSNLGSFMGHDIFWIPFIACLILGIVIFSPVSVSK